MADLANLVNEVALVASRLSKMIVPKVDFIQAVERLIAGIEKKHAKLQGNEKVVVAHGTGHAVVGTVVTNLLVGQPRVEKSSIFPRFGGALGLAYTPPTSKDRYMLFVDELRGTLVTVLGGRVAEELAYAGRVSTGALRDIKRAIDMAYKAVAEFGLSQTRGSVSITTFSGRGLNESGAEVQCGRDQNGFFPQTATPLEDIFKSLFCILEFICGRWKLITSLRSLHCNSTCFVFAPLIGLADLLTTMLM